MRYEKHYLEGIDRENLEDKILSYFKEESFAMKILDNPLEICFFVPAAHNLFMINPKEFVNFYSERFRKDAKGLSELSDREKYGVLLVKAKQLYNLYQNESFLSGEFRNLQAIKFPVREKGSRSVHWGKFSLD